ncbi:MAG: NUDIX domain-containing protein [Bacteroidia bacterium]
MNNPWKTLSTEKIYESDWIEVFKHECLNPVDKPAIYSVVKFKNYAIGIVPLDEENNTWLVGQWRYPLNQYSWEIPEGGGPLNIDPLDSAKRELLEETGIIAEKYTEIMRLHLSNSATDETAIVYTAEGLSFTESEPEESEVLTIKKVSLQKAYEMVLNGEITDAISVAAIMKVWIDYNKS